MLSLSQAAKRTGKSKSVISRALESERLKAQRNSDGSYSINPDDLFSVFPERPPEPPEQNTRTSTGTSTGTSTSTPNGTPAEPDQNATEPPERPQLAAVEAMRAEQAQDMRATIEDLQRRLDQAEADRRQLEADRRLADDNATRQVDQLAQLLAMEKQQVQQTRIESDAQAAQQQTGQTKRRWWLFR